jgi:hypothetical protein
MFGSVRRLTIYAMIASQVALAAGSGCRQYGSGAGGGGTARNAAHSQSNVSIGEVLYQVVRIKIEKSPEHAAEKLAAFDARHADFVQAIDTVIPKSVANNVPALLDDVIARVDDGTLPALFSNVASVLELLANDPQDPQGLTLEALAKLLNARSALDKATALKLAGRLFAYPDLSALLEAIAKVVSDHDGLDAKGQPAAAERDLLSELLGVLSRRLSGLERPLPGARQGSNALVDALLEPIALRGGQAVGAPAWAVRVDPNGNPKVATDAQGRIYPPFVDRNGDRVADVNADGAPIDALGNVVDIPAFGNSGLRDADGRALAPNGQPLYEYFDAKRTALGQLLAMAGDMLRADVPEDLLEAFDSLAGRVQRVDASGSYVGYSDDNPVLDMAWGGLEVFRYQDAPKLLEGLSALIQRDRRKAESLIVHLAQVLEIARNSTFVAPASQGSMLDEIVPLLDDAFKSNGRSNASPTARALLNAFNSQQARLRNLPQGFAKMMKYSDVNPWTLKGPNDISLMERLLDMMEEANRCDWTVPSWIPFLGGLHINMAEIYLQAMAGNLTIGPITVSVYTINGMSSLIPTICSPVQRQNLVALEAFANSGALDAMIPIAKVFSDAHQIPTLKNIMLALQARYATDMRPNEDLIVEILESGMVEELFDALNLMTTLRVPSTNEVLSDVTADFLAAMVDRSRGVVNRHGQPVMSLLHLVMQPLSAMSERIDARGLRPQFERAKNAALDIALETIRNDNGTPADSSDDFRELKNQSLVPLAAAALKKMAASMSMFPSIRNQDINRYQQDVISLMTGRDLPIVVDLLLAIEQSGVKPEIHRALVNLFATGLPANQDAYGSICEVLASLLQAKTDPTAMTDVLRFAGRALDPSRGLSKPIITGLVKLLGAGPSGDGTLVAILRNATDKGPAGTAQSPVETILAIVGEVKAAGGAQASAPVTAADIREKVLDMVEFIRDPSNGLEKIWNTLRGRKK